MACLICGKSMVPEETINHINNIEVKKVKIDEEIGSIFTSDINRAVNLIVKSEKHAKEIKHLSTGTAVSLELLCDDCCSKIKQSLNNKNQKQINEPGYSKAKENVKALKIFTYMSKKSIFELEFELDELREKLCDLYHPNDVNEIINEKNELINKLRTEFVETNKMIQEGVNFPESNEYYVAKLFYILGYYNEIVLHFFDFKKRLKETDILKYEMNINGYYKEALLHYQNVEKRLIETDDKKRRKIYFNVKLIQGNLIEEEQNDYKNGINQWIDNIKEMIYEINEKIERNKKE